MEANAKTDLQTDNKNGHRFFDRQSSWKEVTHIVGGKEEENLPEKTKKKCSNY